MTIRIFTIATNYYKEYFIKYFLPTVNNIFPNYMKEIILFSDGLKEYDDKIFENTCVHVKHIYDLYSFDIQFNKFNFVNQELQNCNDNDLLMWIDSDTIFCHNELGESFILDNYMSDNVFITEHPNYYIEYVYNQNYIQDRINEYSNELNEGIFTVNEVNKPELITSFCYFNKQSFNIFFNIYNSYIKEMNLQVPRIMPKLNDEAIVNYMYYNNIGNILGKFHMTMNVYIENNTFDKNIAYIPSLNNIIGISEDCYIELNNISDLVICNQKFDTSIKSQNKYHFQ